MKKEQFEKMMARASKSIQRLNADLRRVCPKPGECEYPTVRSYKAKDIVETKPRKRIQQTSKPKLNKTELRALEYLKDTYPSYEIRPHEMRLAIANGCTYTPDIVMVHKNTHQITIVEVKGKHAWDDAIVKLKVVARYWCSFDVMLLYEHDDGGWNEQAVLP